MSRHLFVVYLASMAASGCQGVIADTPDSLEPSPGNGTARGLDPVQAEDPGQGRSDSFTPQTPQPVECDATESSLLPPRVVRLNGAQYAKAVDALFQGRSLDANRDRPGYTGAVPFELANLADRFSTHAPSYGVSEAEVPAVVESAEMVAAQLAQSLSEPDASCLADDTDLSDCMASLVEDKGAILFGRPLDAEELESYVSIAAELEEEVGAMAAAATSFEAMLRAPQFLYRSELGHPSDGGHLMLTSHEIASALSYTLTDGPPDQPLWEAAEREELSDKAEIARQVERLLMPLEENAPLGRFLREYLRYDRVVTIAKDAAEHPYHDAELLQDDTSRFIADVLAQYGRQDFWHALLTVDTGVARAATQENYGLSGLGADPISVSFPAGERAGILTQPSWLAGHSEVEANDPIRRGRFIRESLLCGEVPPIPVDDIPPLEERENATLREILAEHRENATCAGCHNLMDPLGLPFEGFDHVGRFRTMEGPHPVDTSGALDSTGDQDGPVEDPVDMAHRLASSETVRRCFVAHAFEFFRGMRWRDAPGCGLEEADASYARSDGDLVELLAAFFTSDMFLLRQTETP